MTTKAEKQQAMFAMIETWKVSGQNQHVFCQSQDIAYSGFHYWYKKYREQHQEEGLSSFVPIRVKNMATGSVVTELILPDGRRLSFYQSVDASYLRALLC